MKNFALIGVGGYVAPRHLKAIKETGNRLVAALDVHDSVGILDEYFSEASFFTEFERFDRHLEKLRRGFEVERVNIISICSPNHLHDAHIRSALRVHADVICEKPLVLYPRNLDAIKKLEDEYGKKVYTVLQLRVHPALLEFKRKINSAKGSKHEVTLTYITSRGLWYNYSWKGDSQKSGGVVTNIGIHFFDLLIWLFGKVLETEVYLKEPNKMSGFIEMENATVKWFLSIDQQDLPPSIRNENKRTFRSIKVDEKEVEFTDGFTNLHTVVYQEVLAGYGFGIEDARPSIELVYALNRAELVVCSDGDKKHPFLIRNKTY